MNGLFISLYDITADHVKGIRKKYKVKLNILEKIVKILIGFIELRMDL